MRGGQGGISFSERAVLGELGLFLAYAGAFNILRALKRRANKVTPLGEQRRFSKDGARATVTYSSACLAACKRGACGQRRIVLRSYEGIV